MIAFALKVSWLIVIVPLIEICSMIVGALWRHKVTSCVGGLYCVR